MSDLRQQLRDHYDAQSLPADRAEAILAQGRAAAKGGSVPGKVVGFPRTWRWVLVAAASFVLFAAGVLWWPREGRPISYVVLAPRVVQFFGVPPELPKRSQDPAELRAWLVAQGAPEDFQIPAKLQALSGFGCQVVDVQGRPAYLACFWREKKPGVDEGELVHLLVTHRRDFRDAPPGATPQFREMNGWSFAAWSEGDVIYTLATAAPLETLRPFVRVKTVPVAFAAL
jgi:hypothetical protein